MFLALATLLNVSVGFTPWVDNFMHLGGMVAGLFVGLAAFALIYLRWRRAACESIVCQSVMVCD